MLALYARQQLFRNDKRFALQVVYTRSLEQFFLFIYVCQSFLLTEEDEFVIGYREGFSLPVKTGSCVAE